MSEIVNKTLAQLLVSQHHMNEKYDGVVETTGRLVDITRALSEESARLGRETRDLRDAGRNHEALIQAVIDAMEEQAENDADLRKEVTEIRLRLEAVEKKVS